MKMILDDSDSGGLREFMKNVLFDPFFHEGGALSKLVEKIYKGMDEPLPGVDDDDYGDDYDDECIVLSFIIGKYIVDETNKHSMPRSSSRDSSPGRLS